MLTFTLLTVVPLNATELILSKNIQYPQILAGQSDKLKLIRKQLVFSVGKTMGLHPFHLIISFC